ncbi:hypothetical protein AVEN_198353-1 [Araneus ventricosus]|uniref:Uncharacterized protein n=1 Tax=Araneus ventricosus TaxID=182803 RepID=A0A4Y2C5T3_ARAVE|nr:hypothetical protein AVEN_198353-1 [Araneus ventricosus]
MEIIRCKIMQILPSLKSNILDSLIKILQDIGVAAEDDLKYVQESDLTAVLKPIQARKLIDVWKQLDSVQTVSTPVTNTTSLESHILASGSDSSESTSVTVQSIPIDWAEDYAIPWQNVWCDEIVAGGCESLTRSFVVKFENLHRRDAFSSVKRKLKRAEKDDSNNDRQLSASSK